MKSAVVRVLGYAVALLLASPLALGAEVTHLNKSGALPAGVPFSEAVRVNDTLYLSGQLGVKPGGPMVLVEGGMEAQARQTLDNIRSVLTANGLDLSDVVKCTVMLADISEWGTFNRIYSEYFSAPFPARSAFAASGLALGARIELECMAVFPG